MNKSAKSEGPEVKTESVQALRKAIGGEFITVKYREDEKGEIPDPKQLFIRSLSVKNADLVVKCIDDEMALATIFSGMEPDALDQLDPESFDQVIEKGREINTSFFAYCSKRMARRKQMQAQFMPEVALREESLMKEAYAVIREKMESLKLDALKT